MKMKSIKTIHRFMNKIILFKRCFRKKTKKDYLSRTNSYLGPIPALPEGQKGHEMLRQAFFALIPILDPEIICDIGANDGSASEAAKESSPRCRVVGFEANPTIYSKNADRLNHSGIEWINMAVSNICGRIPIYMPKTLSRAYIGGKMVAMDIVESENTGKTSLLMRDEKATYEKIEVDSITLNEFFSGQNQKQGNRIYFLWIDVEGAADKVLSGASEVLEKTSLIFIETENYGFWKDQKLSHEVIDMLRCMGFIPVARDREYGDKQFNILFIHESLNHKFDLFLMESGCEFCQWLRGNRNPKEVNNSNPNIVTSVSALMQSEIPIIVPCFNNPTYSEIMLNQLINLDFKDIIIIDNASSSSEMIKWLSYNSSRAGIRVVRLKENLGPRHCFMDDAVLALLPRRFCLTDPDILFNSSLPEDFLAQMALLAEKHRIGKVGFALDISDRHLMKKLDYDIDGVKYKTWEWEEQFWCKCMDRLNGGDEVYDAPIDTTFALYDKKYFSSEDKKRALRIGGRFTARHLPWYIDSKIPQNEECYYRKNQRFSYYFNNKT